MSPSNFVAVIAKNDPMQPALMIYGDQDMIPKSENLTYFVPNVDVMSLNRGHWIQRELPDETTNTILEWLPAQSAA